MTSPLRKLIAAATPGPVTSTADTPDDDVPVDRIICRGNVLAQLWPELGCGAGFEKSQHEGRLYATLRNLATLQCDLDDAADGIMRTAEVVTTSDGRDSGVHTVSDESVKALAVALTALRTAMKEIEDGK
jgi:hypothetical protein